MEAWRERESGEEEREAGEGEGRWWDSDGFGLRVILERGIEARRG